MMRFAEGPLTHLRREVKLVLAPDEAAELATRLGRDGEPVVSRVGVVYFDGPGAPLASRVQAAPHDCVKVRAKGYDPDRSDPPGRVVVEVKRERGGVTSKQRCWSARDGVRSVLSVLVPWLGPLAPVVATSYARHVYQPDPGWRATIDSELTFHRVSWDALRPGGPPWPHGFDGALAIEPRTIVELKYGSDGLPEWLSGLARNAVPYSKFLEAMRHLAPEREAGMWGA